MKCRPVLGNVFQIADLIACSVGIYLDQRSLAMVRLQQSVKRTGLHLLLVSALPLGFRCLTAMSAFDRMIGRCSLDGLRRFRCLSCRRIEQRRLTRLRQLGTVASAARFAARLGDASLLRREAEQVVKRQDGRLDFGLLLFGRGSGSFRFLPNRCGWLLLLQPSIPNAAGVKLHSQPRMQVVVEQFSQLRGDTLCTAVMLVNHCRPAVRIGVQLRTRIDDLLFMLYKVSVGAYAVQRSRLGKQLFILCQPFFAGVLLQDDQVAADFRSGVVGK